MSWNMTTWPELRTYEQKKNIDKNKRKTKTPLQAMHELVANAQRTDSSNARRSISHTQIEHTLEILL
jgi:hypothetical protein